MTTTFCGFQRCRHRRKHRQSERVPAIANLNVIPAKLNGGTGFQIQQTALQAEGPLAGLFEGASADEQLADRMQIEAAPAMGDMLARIEAMLGAAGSLEEFGDMLAAGFADVDASPLAGVLERGMQAAHAAGRVAVEEADRAAADD